MCQEVDPRGDDLDISQEINWTDLNVFIENIKSLLVKAITTTKRVGSAFAGRLFGLIPSLYHLIISVNCGKSSILSLCHSYLLWDNSKSDDLNEVINKLVHHILFMDSHICSHSIF